MRGLGDDHPRRPRTVAWLLFSALAPAAAFPVPTSPPAAWLGFDPIFLDGFESAECSLWSASTSPIAAPDEDVDDFGDETLPTVNCVQPPGYVLDASDCDDSNPAVHPGALEICNNLDDDCDPLTLDGDQDPGVGEPCDGPDGDLCLEGTTICSVGVLECTDNTPTNIEICNNLDDDCDGVVDAFDDICYTGPPGTLNVGVCVAGLSTCTAGQWGPCIGEVTPTPESCNNLDDDCDGQVDDGIVSNTNPACLAHTFLGTIAGDAGSAQLSASSFDEQYYRFTLAETDPGTVDLQARVRLLQPPTVDFDLYVYCLSCGGTLAGSSTLGAGQTDVVFVGRDDGIGDQTYDVLVEVRHVSANPCGFWQLEITGNVASANRACN